VEGLFLEDMALDGDDGRGRYRAVSHAASFGSLGKA
jgi:hypothetical protein